jgi:transposase
LNAAASAVNVDTMRALLALSAVPIFAAALTAQAGSEVLTQLRRLVDHVPAKAAPRDEDVVAAESELAKSMSGIVEEAGEAARELQRLFDERAARLVPSEHAPIREHDPLARTLVRFDTERVLATAPERVVAHPASSSFPGSVPAGAALVEKVLEVDLSVPGRHSTGLYAAPGADSGKRRGYRKTKGGRADVRSVLYMATLTACRYNPLIKPQYEQLVKRGKVKKVALTACMRKFLVILNAMMRDGHLFQHTTTS